MPNHLSLDTGQPDSGLDVAFFVRKFPKLSESFILNQATGLIDQGCDVTIVSLERPDETKTHELIDKYDLYERTVYVDPPASYPEGGHTLVQSIGKLAARHPRELPAALRELKIGTQLPKRLASLVTLLDAGKFDIHHVHFGTMLRYWRFLARVDPGTPLVATFYGADVSKEVHPDRYDYYEGTWEDLDLAQGITYHILSRMLMLGCPESLTEKHPIGIRTSRFDAPPTPIEPDAPLRLLSVCRLVEKKGIRYAVEAVADCLERGIDIEYVIGGGGPLEEELKAQMHRLGISDAVSLLGWQTQSEVRDLLSDAHIFVQPSVTTPDGDMEGQSLVLQEAQAMSTPVVSTYHNGIPEGVTEAETGLLVPERDVESLSEAIEQFARNPGRVAEFGDRGSEFVQREFDNADLCRQQIDIYERLLSGGHGQ